MALPFAVRTVTSNLRSNVDVPLRCRLFIRCSGEGAAVTLARAASPWDWLQKQKLMQRYGYYFALLLLIVSVGVLHGTMLSTLYILLAGAISAPVLVVVVIVVVKAAGLSWGPYQDARGSSERRIVTGALYGLRPAQGVQMVFFDLDVLHSGSLVFFCICCGSIHFLCIEGAEFSWVCVTDSRFQTDKFVKPAGIQLLSHQRMRLRVRTVRMCMSW